VARGGPARRWARLALALGDGGEAACVTYAWRLPLHVSEEYGGEPRVVDAQGYVVLQTNRDSVPARLADNPVEVCAHKYQVVALYDGKVAAVLPALRPRSKAPAWQPLEKRWR